MVAIPKIPTIKTFSSFLSEGYNFIRNRCLEHHTNFFEIDLPLGKVICMTGAEAAAKFYDPNLFERRNAIPNRVQKTLLGEGGVQTLDGEQHRRRKELFMSLMTKDSISQLLSEVEKQLVGYAKKWERQDSVVLFEETKYVLCKAACDWAGIPIRDEEITERSSDFGAMVDAFGAMGPRHWRGRQSRKRAEEWLMHLINAIRNQRVNALPGSPFDKILTYHEEGKLLDEHMVAVEMINLIRPIVAISTYISFAVMARHQYPEHGDAIVAAGDTKIMENFIHEVRRYYPFAPVTGARVKQDFEWKGYLFPKNTLVLLDIFGTNRDPIKWKHADQFDPTRFNEWQSDPYDFIPQGGGDYRGGHRCAGEGITIEITKLALTFFTQRLDYRLLPQDLHYSLTRIPTFPRSGLVISSVRLR